MERSALLAALVAATAAIALVLGAAALGPTLAGEDGGSGTVEPPDEPPKAEESGDGGSTPGSDGGTGASCPSCSALDVRSQVAALFPPVDPRLLLGALAVSVVGLAAVGLRAPDDETAIEAEDRAGGALADHRRPRSATPAPDGDAEPANDVYRAWLALGDALDDSRPAATSPRERAHRAIEAGFPAEPVESLTRTFEAVRYGTAAPTPERERRARTALDRLDGVELPDKHANGSGTDGTSGGPADGDPTVAGLDDTPDGGGR